MQCEYIYLEYIRSYVSTSSTNICIRLDNAVLSYFCDVKWNLILLSICSVCEHAWVCVTEIQDLRNDQPSALYAFAYAKESATNIACILISIIASN